MYKRTDNQLGTDPEDIEDVLKIIETSYDIKFEENELGHIKTFGELTDHIISKIRLTDKDDCTTQQGFYKLRDIIQKTKNHDKKTITTNQLLTTIFPRQRRKKEIKEIEEQLGFKLKALRPRRLVTWTILILLGVSIVGLFIDWKYGLSGVLLTIILFWTAEKTGIEFKDKTLGELTDRITQRNYLKSRRDQTTVNKGEIENKIRALFADELSINKTELNRQTIIN
ncbi:MAG: hypothetical protein KF763_21190 [Cyclobacteriaceae bacterium]|nr:hypothetical protein [Cyclobacteriaceae bacterium]